MRELSLVGPSEDGSALVLSAADGTRFRLPLDERVVAATRRSASVGLPGAQPIADELTPRMIQTLLRAGGTAAEIASAHGADVERVRRFEGPILGERAHVAEQARAVEIRRPHADRALEQVVVEKLSSRGVDPDGLRWDAWRRDDGRWTVLVAWPVGGAATGHGVEDVACWVYDAAGRTVVADDDEARWLIGDREYRPGEEPQTDTTPIARDEESDSRVLAFPRPVETPIDDEISLLETPEEPELPADAEAPVPAPAAKTGRRRGREKGVRASVPSWDEILFGGRGNDSSD